MKFAIHTLGCKVNQYETQAMQQILGQRGHESVPFDEAADIYIINTCSVTAVSDKKSRQMIRRARKLSPDGVVAVCGCYTQTHADELDDLNIDLVSGTGDKMGFIDQLEQTHRERQPVNMLDNAFERKVFEYLPAGGLEGRTRAMLKIEDGCVNFCTYCIIPYARGRIRSLNSEDTAVEVRRLVDEGYREIVVTGIEISSWGQDLPDGQTLIDLLEIICHAVPDYVRIRLGSLEPRTITEDFCRRIAVLTNICPHFHLSMQSGSDSVLERMNRKYDSERYFQSVELLRTYLDDPAITTDLIVGFPQETEQEFCETLDFITRCNFASMHIFPYSIRSGTPAASMDGQILKAVKEERSTRASAIATQMQQKDLQNWIGRTVDVLFEECRQGSWRGHTGRYTAVSVESEEQLQNSVKQVELTGVEGGILQGILV